MITRALQAIRFNQLMDREWHRGFEPDKDLVKAGGDCLKLTNDPMAASESADLITTDVWASMGQGPFSALWFLVFILPLFLFTPDRKASGKPFGQAVSEGMKML